MKKIKKIRSLAFLIIFATIAFISCNKNEQDSLLVQKKTSDLTFNISARVPNGIGQTRLASISRYIVEIYKTDDPNTLIQRVEQASGTIAVTLESNYDYTCLFWADGVTPNDNANGTYNASDLKNVTLNSGKDMDEAFYAKLDITNTLSTYNVSLKRATAQVNIIKTDVSTVPTSIEVMYDRYTSFNTFTSEVSGIKTLRSDNFNTTATTGTIGTFLTFASVIGILTDFTITYNTATINTIINIPLKANYITNIHGEYSIVYHNFTVTASLDDNWENEVNGVEINVGTTTNPKWIKIADRNADKNGPHSGTTSNTATDYGYYYQWSNANNDASNAEKAYNACYTFGEGGGTWRLPTEVEGIVIVGYGTSIDNEARKLQWDGTMWKLYEERNPSQTSNFVYFPLSGFIYKNTDSVSYTNEYGFYWCSTPFQNITGDAWYLLLNNAGSSYATSNSGLHKFSVRCVRDM